MQTGIVEKLALNPPSVAIHLRPLLARVNADLHVGRLERRDRRGGRRNRRSRARRQRSNGTDKPIGTLPVESLLAVMGYLKIGHSGEGHIAAAFFQVKAVDNERRRPGKAASGGGFDRKEVAGLAGLERDVAASRHGDGQHALEDIVEVDLHLRHFWRRRAGRFGCIGLGWFGSHLLLVALWRQRRRVGLRQHDQVEAAGGGAAAGLYVRLKGGPGVGGRREVQILAVAIPNWMACIAHAVGHLLAPGGGDIIEEDGAQVIAQRFRIGQPLRIGRPRRRQRPSQNAILIDLRGLGGFQIHRPEIQVHVRKGDLLRVRRPNGVAVESGLFLNADALHFAPAILLFDVQIVLAGRVGEIGDGQAIGRPGRVTIHRAGAIRQIADIAFFGGHRQNLAAAFKRRSRAGGRNAALREASANPLKAWANCGHIRRHRHVQRTQLAVFQVVDVQRPQLLNHDGVLRGRGGFKVEPLVLRSPRYFLR